MSTIPSFDPLAFQAQALRLRSERHSLLASNLANADTPGYLARDIDFAERLREQVSGAAGVGMLPLRLTNPAHLDRKTPTDEAGVLFRTVLQPAADGNTVDPDVERAHFAENAIGFEAATALLSSTLRSRQMALTGQP